MIYLAADDAMAHVLDHTLVEIGGVPVITLHMVMLVLCALLTLWIMKRAALAIGTGPESEGNDRYLTKGALNQLIEMIVLFLKDNMIEPVLGEKQTRRYLPYLLSVFFFILTINLVGLVPLLDFFHLLGWHHPWLGGTATANLAVTGALAVVSLVVIQVHAFRELGAKGWAHHLLGGAPWWLFPIMVPVELAGHIIKPAALAIRLLANMVAGHTLLATLFLFGKSAAAAGKGTVAIGGISIAAGVFAFLISFLELFVGILQAFIFMFLTAVFISLMSHHDEHEAHDETHGSEPAAAAAH